MLQKEDDQKEELNQPRESHQKESEGESFYFLEEEADGYSLFREEKGDHTRQIVQRRIILPCWEGDTENSTANGLCESLFSAAIFGVEDGKVHLKGMNEAMKSLQEKGLLRTETLADAEVLRYAAVTGHCACGELPAPNEQEHRLAAYCIPIMKKDRTEKVLAYVWCMERELSCSQRCLKTLTPREKEIITLAAEGMTNKYIARHLSVSEGTVKKVLYHGYRKLRVGSRFDLIKLFHQK